MKAGRVNPTAYPAKMPSFSDVLPLQALLFVLLTCFIASGCAGTPRNIVSAVLPDNEAWKEALTAPQELLGALTQGQLEYIGNDPYPIPVRVYGSENTKLPVVMTHGLQSHSGWFAQSAAFMAQLGHPVYALDRQGSGLSSAPRGDCKDFTTMINDINAVAISAMQRHNASSFFLLGHCFGAIPAAAYGCTHPQTLQGLLLTTPAIYTQTSVPWYQALRILFTRSGRRNYLVPAPLDPEWFSELEAYEEFIRQDSLSLTAATGDFYYEVMRARRFISKNACQLTMPIFMALAGEDPICDNRRNKKFFTSLPAQDKTLLTYNDARHILEFSRQRDVFFTDLASWLHTHEERP